MTVTLTKPRNTTYIRFQIINARQEPNETIEKFYSTLRELGAKTAFGAVDEVIIKDVFTGKTGKMVKLENPAQALNFALVRERGQQKEK